jgi:DNA-binding beta-propeller fold protein YncE
VRRREFLAGAAAVALAPRGLAGTSRRLALVTADLESRLVAVDLAAGRVVRHIPTEAYPRSIETVGAFAVVAHSDLGMVSIVHTPTLSLRHLLRGFREPRYTAAHSDGRYAFVTDAELGELVTVDVPRGRVVARLPVGARARHLGIHPGGRLVWVALGSKAEELAVVDVSKPARPRLVRRFGAPFLAHDVGFAPDGRHVWVSSGDVFRLAVYDVRSGRVVARPSGDWPPQHVTFAGGTAYVTSGWSGTLEVHHVGGRPLRRSVVPVGSYNVQQAGGWVVTPALGHGEVTIADLRGHVLRTLTVARSSHDTCIV